MLEDLMERLNRLLTGKRDDQWQIDSKELRAMIEAHKAEKEAELQALADASDELDYVEAMADSFQGGPDASDSGDNDGM